MYFPFHFISFHFISFHFISFHFISFHFISFHFISFYLILFYLILFYFILFYFILFYFILFYFICQSSWQSATTACANYCGPFFTLPTMIHNRRQTTTPGTTCPTLSDKCVGSFTSHRIINIRKLTQQDGWKTQDGRMTKKCRARLCIPNLTRDFFVILPS